MTDLTAVHERAMRRITDVTSVLWDERRQCLEDRRFANIRGAQWEDEFGSLLENAPKMEVNKTRRGVRRILSEYRKNRITVDFKPGNTQAAQDTADTLDGMYRADEQRSGAQEAYDNAADEAFTGGFGAWRLRNVYLDEYDEDEDRQRIAIEPVFDADVSVFFDLNAKRQDKADARYAFILSSMTLEAFKDQYEGKSTAPVPTMPQPVFDWFSPDLTYVAEYYEVEETPDERLTFVQILTGQEEKHRRSTLSAEEEAELKATGWTLASRKKIKRKRVHKYVLSGAEVLKDEGYIAGCHIPIVPVYGERVYIQNVERANGYVRLAKDPQRIYNTQVSKLTEMAGLAPYEVPIFAPEQVAGLETQWAEGNIKRHPYRLAHPIRDDNGTPVVAGPLGKVEPPQIPTPLAALIQIANNDVSELTGASNSQDQLVSNVSADAIEMVQGRVDDEAFVYLDNFAKAMTRSGEIWLSMVKDIADEDEEYMTVTPDGQQQPVKLAEAYGAGKRNDIWSGKFDVVPDVGPSSTSRREATVRNLVKMAQAAANDPELQNTLLSTAMLNMDGEGLSDVQRYIRMRLVRAGVIEPTEEEQAQLAEEQANTPPDPTAQVAEAAAAQAMAEAKKAEAGTIKTLADVEKVKAETVKTLSEVDRAEVDQTLNVVTAAADRLAQDDDRQHSRGMEERRQALAEAPQETAAATE